MSPIENNRFESTRFINRKKEMVCINALVSGVEQSLRSPAESSQPQKVVVFNGERGLGKTWLLRQVEFVMCKKPDVPVKCCYINMKDYQGLDPLVAVRTILVLIAQIYLGTHEKMELGAGELSHNVIKNIGKALNDRILVLLIDHVYESRWELLGTLETFVLAPLVVRPNVVLIMAGRGQPFPWTNRELGVKPEELTPFNLEDTQRQLNENPAEAQAVQAISHGIPLANFYLRKGTEADDLLGYIKDMLEVVSDSEKDTSRDSLIALSILQAFDETRLKAMLAIYQGVPEWEYASYGKLRQIKEILLRNGFATWIPTARGNVLQETTRKILEKYLQLKQPDKWRKMHEKAIEIYTDYLKKYSSGADRWEQEIKYHQGQLRHPSISEEFTSHRQGR